MSEGQFARYAEYYDALYADKDYVGETRFIENILKKYLGTRPISILEFGSGTGKHAIELCQLGNSVFGIEPSKAMISAAKSHPGFKLIEGDIRNETEYGSFDACIAMFHVMSYLGNLDDVRKAFKNAARNLKEGGLFAFDVWHAPAVKNIGTTDRSKEVQATDFSIRRVATATDFEATNQVNVNFRITVTDVDGNTEIIIEDHLMRYFWQMEINEIGVECGFSLRDSMESFSGDSPSNETWSVMYVFQLDAAS
jgi:SAM-dependent methyltransferase